MALLAKCLPPLLPPKDFFVSLVLNRVVYVGSFSYAACFKTEDAKRIFGQIDCGSLSPTMVVKLLPIIALGVAAVLEAHNLFARWADSFSRAWHRRINDGGVGQNGNPTPPNQTMMRRFIYAAANKKPSLLLCLGGQSSNEGGLCR